jgi:hypothetical protein
MTEHDRRATDNRAAIMDRLASICARPDGTLHMESIGLHYVTVVKEGDRLQLWLMARGSGGTGVIQSELDLKNPLALVDPYTQACTLGLLWKPAAERMLFFGLGGGCLPLVLYHHLPAAHLDCIEIDPEVVSVARTYFGLEADNRLRIHVDDGRRWLAGRRDGQAYDLIVVDAFLDNGHVPYGMTTEEFFRLCRGSLSEQGVLVVNVLYGDPFHAQRINTLYAVFEHVYLCPLQEENDVLFASNVPLPSEPKREAMATAIRRRYRFAFPFVRHAVKLRSVDRPVDGGDGLPGTFVDDAPPANYSATLPSFAGLDVVLSDDMPCPCGSGRLFGHCHRAEK